MNTDNPIITEDKDVMIFIQKKSFRCDCGCNVFRRLKADRNKYVCNACGETYEGIE